MTDDDGLRALFEPSAIAVVGASSAPVKLGAAMVRSLAGFPGPVLPVNARSADPDAGVYASVAEAVRCTGTAVDLVVSCVPAATTAAALEEAARAGASAALVCAGGFAEVGAAGAALQARIAEVARTTGLRILGPNTSGFIAPDRGLTASFVPGAAAIPAGPVAVIAASGGMNHALSFALAGAGTGVRLAVGLGNAVDVGAADVLTHVTRDGGARVVALHIESVSDGPALLAAVSTVADRTPVVALVVGRSDVGDFAQSHTGALATSWRTTRAALRQAGAVLVDDDRDLVDSARALAARRLPPTRSPRVGVVTAQAGPGLLMADALRSAGVDVPRLSQGTTTSLSSLLPPLTYQQNPVDTGRPDAASFPEVIRVVAADPAIDATAVYALLEPDAYDLAAALPADPGHPVVVMTAGAPLDLGGALHAIGEKNLPVYASVGGGVRGLLAVVEDSRTAWRRGQGDGDRRRSAGGEPLVTSLDELDAKDLLRSRGLATPRGMACEGRDEARAALAELGGPVVVKVLDPELIHKSDVGGVVLGVRTSAEMDAAIARLAVLGRRVLVETMVPAGPELIVGAQRDPVFGPVVLVGLGGLGVEAMVDVSLRTVPLSRRQAATMLDDLVGADIVRGYRGGAAVSSDALVDAVLAVAGIVADHPAVTVVEVNPLRVLPDGGVVALDAVVTVDPPDYRDERS